MRKAVFLFVAFFTGYMAGEFRQLWLMVLFAMELFLFGASFLLTIYFRGKFSVEFPRHSEAAEKGTWFPCRIRIKNAGRLPVSRFQIKVCYGYAESVGTKDSGRTQENSGTREICGSCDSGENTFQFEMMGKYCGIMTLRIVRLRVYDYLALFSTSCSMEETVEAAVYPGEQALNLGGLLSGNSPDMGFAEETVSGSGESGSEVRQLREYRSGDSSRYIHWNQSARTGQLWVKEYEKESDAAVGLFLNLEGLEDAGVRELDAFYELLSALILGLLEKVRVVRVRWYEAKRKCFREKEVENREENRELLLQLYRLLRGRDSVSRVQQKGAPGAAESKKPENAGHSFLTLDGKLRLYRKGEMVCAFSAECLERQIREFGMYPVQIPSCSIRSYCSQEI